MLTRSSFLNKDNQKNNVTGLKLKKKAMKALAKRCIKKIKDVLNDIDDDEIEITINTKYSLSFHRHESSFGTFFSQQFVAVPNVVNGKAMVNLHRSTAYVDDIPSYFTKVVTFQDNNMDNQIDEDFVMNFSNIEHNE
jgi:hypothetical protein